MNNNSEAHTIVTSLDCNFNNYFFTWLTRQIVLWFLFYVNSCNPHWSWQFWAVAWLTNLRKLGLRLSSWMLTSITATLVNMDVEQFAWIFLVLMGINLYEWLKLYFPFNPQKLPAVSNSWVDLWVHFFQQNCPAKWTYINFDLVKLMLRNTRNRWNKPQRSIQLN